MNNKIVLPIILLLSILNLDAQTILSEDSLFQNPLERKAHIFEHLTLPEILWDNGLPLVDFSSFDGNGNTDVIANSRIFGLAYASIYSIPKPSTYQLPDPDIAYSNEMTSSLGFSLRNPS